jgi:hypothetical protein
MPLEKEIRTFEREKPNLLSHQGKFVVIAGDEIAGVYVAYEDALRSGYQKFGLKPFLVRKIQAVEQAEHFTRDLALACRT